MDNLPELFKKLPEYLEGTWEKNGIKIHNKAIDKSLYIFYSPKVVMSYPHIIEAYGVIIDHNENGEPNKYILKNRLNYVLKKLTELKEKL